MYPPNIIAVLSPSFPEAFDRSLRLFTSRLEFFQEGPQLPEAYDRFIHRALDDGFSVWVGALPTTDEERDAVFRRIAELNVTFFFSCTEDRAILDWLNFIDRQNPRTSSYLNLGMI